MYVIWKGHPEYGYGEVQDSTLPTDKLMPEGSVTAYFSYRDKRACLIPEQFEVVEPEQPSLDVSEGELCCLDSRRSNDATYFYDWSNLDPDYYNDGEHPNVWSSYDNPIGLIKEIGLHYITIQFAGLDGTDCEIWDDADKYRKKDENGKLTWDWDETQWDGPILTIRFLTPDWRTWEVKNVRVCSMCGEFMDEDYCRYPDEGSHMDGVFFELCEGCADNEDVTVIDAVGADAGDLRIGNVTYYSETNSNRVDEFASDFTWTEDKDPEELEDEREIPFRHIEEMPENKTYPQGDWIMLPNDECLWEHAFEAVDHFMGRCQPKSSYDELPKPWWMKVVYRIRKWDATFYKWTGKWFEKHKVKYPVKKSGWRYKLGHWWYNVWREHPRRWSHLLGTRTIRMWKDKRKKRYAWFQSNLELFGWLETKTRAAYAAHDTAIIRAHQFHENIELMPEYVKRPWLWDNRPDFTLIRVNYTYWMHVDDIYNFLYFLTKALQGVYDRYGDTSHDDLWKFLRTIKNSDMSFEEITGVVLRPSYFEEYFDELKTKGKV